MVREHSVLNAQNSGVKTRNWKNNLQEAKLLANLKSNPFVLAPMAGITDCAFRSFMKEMGCGVVVTELVSANGLHYESDKTRKIMKFEEIQSPIGIQIFGENLENLAEAAKYSESTGADFVDINFGCPVPKVVKKGAGSAALRDLNQLAQVLRAVKTAVSIPVTIKIRTGWDENSKNSIEVARIAREEGISWVAIHGRTRAAGYSGKADWDYITEVKANSIIPILGNGDITSPKLAVSRLHESKCDGVLIGRGCLKNPWIFKQAMRRLKGELEEVEKDFLSVFERLTHHLSCHFPDRIVLLQLKKLSAWFSAGYPGSSHFRRDLFASKELGELQGRIQIYFESIQSLVQNDTSEEAFLMGGHG